MVRLLARVIGVGIETADMLVHEVLSRNLRDRRAVARYAGLTGSPDESGSKRREKGLAKAGNARVRRGMIQLAWRNRVHVRAPEGDSVVDADLVVHAAGRIPQNRCSIGVQMRVRHHQLGFSSFPTPHTRGAKKWTAQPPPQARALVLERKGATMSKSSGTQWLARILRLQVAADILLALILSANAVESAAALLFVGGVMNLFWIAALAILVLLEKVIPSGRIIARLAGLAFMAGGGWMLIQHA